MKSILTKIAAVLALIIGAMAVFAGAQVLLGNDPGYYVINWVPVYNYTAGILTVFITAILIWRGSKLAWFAAITTFSLHTLVMVILQTAYRDVVAVDSIRAMTIRMIVWAIILVLMSVQSRKDKKAQLNRGEIVKL
ncbi:MAG: hypothetical protein CVU41_09935 [Chloroflexi bacterium HGW-Chloroflexi-3]|nr:MAG: hypothetical protein CVU41_09935 [Chloroflexi bacterium HGW-Chloroflexi-3]